MIAFGVLCAIAGGIIGRYGPQLFPVKRSPAPAVQTLAPPSPAAPAPSPPHPAASPPAPAAGEVGALTARIAQLETGQRRIAGAAAAALAADALSQAAETSRPFPGPLAAAQRLLPDSPPLNALQPLAQTGAPSRATLTLAFESLTDHASVAARAPGGDAGLLARLRYLMTSIFIVRRVDASGASPDAMLARAQGDLDQGDLDGALREIAALPPAGREALADWRVQAERRVEIDRLVAQVRDQAMGEVASASGQAAPT